MAAGRRREALRDFEGDVRLERRAFLLLAGEGERPVYDDYVISHRIAARDNSGLPFTIPKRGHPYPRSSLPAQLLAIRTRTRAPERTEALEDALFRAVFVDLADTGDPDVLRAAARSAGLDPSEVDAALADPALKAQAIAEHIEAGEHGVSGIPAVVVPGQPPVVGAVPADVYRATLARALGRPVAEPKRRLPRAPG